MICVNFEDTYAPASIAKDLSQMTFYSPCENADSVLLKVEISSLGHTHLPDVYNLAFGPLTSDGRINDTAKIKHQDPNKVFSTIIFFSLVYLQENPEKTIGIDGSNDVRAYLYHRMFQSNRDYLGNYFIAVGVDWYVRLLRKGDIEKDPYGFPFFKPKPESFDYTRSTQDLYRYYMYHLK